MLFVISLTTFQQVGAKPRCGGVLTAARGTVQTPGFPKFLPTPIHCEWIIDAQTLMAKNTSIVVYLTQLFVFEGLKFTEYQVYDETFHFNGRDLLVVNETNVVSAKTVVTSQSYLVISLQLATLDGTHLRVLDNFLDVFGFNISYEVTETGPRGESCNMAQCGFNGVCLDLITTFACSCFEGFSGKYCSEGPRSLCGKKTNPACQNGGSCRHVGATTVKCLCPDGFAGELCEKPLVPGNSEDSEGSSLGSCPFSGKKDETCNCIEAQNRTGFFASVHLGNLPKLGHSELQQFVQNQMKQVVQKEFPALMYIFLKHINVSMDGNDAALHIYADKKDGEALKSVFTRWSARRFISNSTILEEDINFGPVLSIVSLSVNKPGTIRSGEDFILSCAARGFSGLTFRWMKDGVFIDVSHSWGRKWNRIIKDPHIDGQYTSVLGVTDADVLDEGIFTCQVEDFGFQRCISKKIQIKRTPVVALDPMSLTVHKESNFTIKCICSDAELFHKLTYSWTKNRELLPARTDRGSYEILYPTGSILQIHKAEKTARYSCLVQDGIYSTEAAVDVVVIASKNVKTCDANNHSSIIWAETAPDVESIQKCPEGYVGKASRYCGLSSSGPSWRKPDFSKCTSREIQAAFNKFMSYRLGYETSVGVIEILDILENHLQKRLLPGEGGGVLTLTRRVITFMNTSKYNFQGDSLIRIIDAVLIQKDSLVTEKQVELLQQTLKEATLVYSSLRVNASQSSFHQNGDAVDVSLAQIDKTKSVFQRIPLPQKSYPKWFPYKLEVNLEHASLGDSLPVLVSVVYRNLSSFLPRRSTIRLGDGSEIDFMLLSEIASTWIFDKSGHNELVQSLGLVLSMEFAHAAQNSSFDKWESRCAVSEFAMFDNGWDIQACNTDRLNETSTRCFCGKTGTFAIILTNKSPKKLGDKLEMHKFLVTLGCSICFILSTATGFVMLFHWSHSRTCLLFVKLQCCFSVSGAMVVFVVALSLPESSQSASFSMCMMVFLETFLLIAASTQLSKLLVVYAEFVNFPRANGAKLTVIGIITGVPLITVFGNHTAHRAMNIKLKTWWIVTGSLSFYVFMTCFIIIILLYIFIYVVVGSKIHQFLKYHQKDLPCFQQRIYLLHKSALVFIFLIITTLSSIAYVNNKNEIFWHYEFCVINISLGLVIVYSYVFKKEIISQSDSLEKMKHDSNDLIHASSKNSHLTFYTKEEAEAESESTPETKYMGKTTKVRFAPEPQIDLIDHPSNDVLEDYNCSPKAFRRGFPLSDVVPDTRQAECLELDLVISFKQEEAKRFDATVPRITLAGSDRDVMPKREKMLFTTFQKEGQSKSDKDDSGRDLDVVLSSISQDLDYLLNREEDLRNTLERKRLSSPKKKEQRDSEVPKYPESLTEISRTHC